VAKGSLYLTTPPCPPTRPADLNLALEVVGADVFARYHRQAGRDVRLVAASLEHGRGVERAAYERGGTPQDHAAQWAERWQATLKALTVAYDDFTRTTEPRHQRVVKAFFLKLFDAGDIYKDTREGRYCSRCEELHPHDEAADATCPACGERLTDAAEEAYFLRASKYQKAVVEHLEAEEGFLQPPALREALLESVAEAGLPDPCISRTGHDWAIAVPIDPGHAIADWFDALITYLTTSGYLAEPQMFERYWPPTVQVIGPADVPTHALVWPAVLKAAGLPLPERLLVRGELRPEESPADRKARKPKDPAALADHLGSDAVRYALLRAGDYTVDGVFSEQQITDLRHRDLSIRLARLVETTLGSIEALSDGRIPRAGPARAADQPLIDAATSLHERTGKLIETFDFGAALDTVWSVVDDALAHAEAAGLSEPGSQGRKPARLASTLYLLAEACRLIAHSLQPFLPGTAAAIQTMLGVSTAGQSPSSQLRWGLTQPETRIKRDEPSLTRLVGPADEGQ
jgi:methionyl-tRNA synthetase